MNLPCIPFWPFRLEKVSIIIPNFGKSISFY
jgi:hypothetical protein